MKIKLFKNDYKNKETQPDLRYSFKDENGEWVNFAAGWVKYYGDDISSIDIDIDLDNLEKYKANQAEYYKSKAQKEKGGAVDGAFNEQSKILDQVKKKPRSNNESPINPADLPF